MLDGQEVFAMIRSTTVDDFENKRLSYFWDRYFLPIGLPLLLGLALGPLLAVLIVGEDWIFALPVTILVPLIVLTVRYPFAAVVIWMVVMPWFPFEGTYKYVYYVIHRLLIPLALGSALLSRMLRLKIKQHRPVQLGLVDLVMLAFGAMGIVSILLTGNHWKTILVLHDRFLVPFMAYWLTRFSDSKQQELERLLPFMLFISLAEYAIGLMSWFAPQALPLIWHTRLIGDRITGTFGQPGPYACMLMFFAVPLYHHAITRERGFIRTFLLLVFSLGVICIIFTFTRSVWLAGLFVLLGLVCLYPRTTIPLVAGLALITLILSGGPLANEFAHASERLEATQEAVYDRSIQAEAGKNMFYARPVFGWGFSNYDRYDWKFMERTEYKAPTRYHVQKSTSHNTYLTVLAEMGAVGFIFLYFPVIWWLVLTLKALPRLPAAGFWGRRLLIALWLPIGAQAFVSQSIDIRFFHYALTLFWINLALIANLLQGYLQPGDAG